MTNLGTETAYRHDHCIHFQKVNISEVRGQFMRSNSCRSAATSIYTLSVMDFDPNGTISEVRVHVGLYLDILDADRLPNAADSPRSSRNRLITMVKVKMKWRKIVSKKRKT